jgi:hypothetical protein
MGISGEYCYLTGSINGDLNLLSAVNGVIYSLFCMGSASELRKPFSQPQELVVSACFVPKMVGQHRWVWGYKNNHGDFFWDRYFMKKTTSGGLKVGD